MKMSVCSLAIGLGLLALTAGAAQAQPVLSPPTVVGATITFNWTSTGASSYNLQAGVASGVYVLSGNVGNVTTYQAVAPAIGVYFVRILDSNGLASNEQPVVVNSLVPPPTAPTNLVAFRNGQAVVISWTPGAGGGPPSAYNLRVGLAPGAANFNFPTAATGLSAGGVAPGEYYLGVSAVNAGGSSAESAEFLLAMPLGGACDAPPAPVLTTGAWGNFLTASWTPVSGAVAYQLSAAGPGGLSAVVPFGGGITSFLYPGLPVGTWNFGIQAQFSCGSVGAAGTSVLTVDSSSLRMQPRVPDNTYTVPGYLFDVIRDIGQRFDGELQQSCREHGGNNRWLFRVLRELRTRDKRWGLNWKRANVGDMSQDVLTFNWGDEPDEGAFKLRAWDVIGNHCGSGRAGFQWNEITNPLPPNYSFGARWTLLPYIQAGNVP